MKNNVILFDIDYTLFDVGKYRELVFKKLSTFFPQTPDFFSIAEKTYEEIRQSGWFEKGRFTNQLIANLSLTHDSKELEDVWGDDVLLEDALYPEAVSVLSALNAENFTLGIFSSGYPEFQKSKIAKLAHFFAEEHIHIHEIKDTKLPAIVQKYHGRKIYLIDDYIPVIEKAKKTDPEITTIWIKRGRLSERVAPSKNYPPDYTIMTLRELLKIVR